VTGCVVAGCRDEAIVVAADPTGDRALVCRWHWQDMLRASGGVIRAVALAPAKLELW